MALSKTGRFLSKAEILGVGVFPPLSMRILKTTVVFYSKRSFPFSKALLARRDGFSQPPGRAGMTSETIAATD